MLNGDSGKPYTKRGKLLPRTQAPANTPASARSKTLHIKTAPLPRSHLATSALWRVSVHSSSVTWFLSGRRSGRKWYCGHQSARSFQNTLKLLLPCVVQNCSRVSARVFHVLRLCRQAAWSSLMKRAPRMSRSPLDSSAAKKIKNQRKYSYRY